MQTVFTLITWHQHKQSDALMSAITGMSCLVLLLQSKQQSTTLGEKVEDPSNTNRIRLLGGRIPEKEELVAKLQVREGLSGPCILARELSKCKRYCPTAAHMHVACSVHACVGLPFTTGFTIRLRSSSYFVAEH